MTYPLHNDLKINPPKLSVVENAREVIIHTISAMCDNKGKLTLKKNADGDFKLNGNGYSISNWQMKADIDELCWCADSGEWNEVFRMINTGTSQIQSVRSR